MDCKVDVEMRTPPRIRGTGPEEQDRVLGHEGDTRKEMTGAIPPQDDHSYSWSLEDHHGRDDKASTSEDAYPEQEGKERRDDPQDCAKQRRFTACKTERQIAISGSKPIPASGKPSKRGSPDTTPDK